MILIVKVVEGLLSNLGLNSKKNLYYVEKIQIHSTSFKGGQC